jgi:Protein of unknown function (DUF4058)
MDPYLEGYLWADVHQALASQIRRQLVPLVHPTYAVRLAVSMINDNVPAQELGAVYPDVEVVQIRETAKRYLVKPRFSPAPLTFELAVPVQVRMVSVEIRDTAHNRLITSIEILSPANKREPGLSAYLSKRDELRMARVHVLEIDLLRRGTRPWPDAPLPACDYLFTLIRASASRAEAWPLSLRQSLPVIPVPLREPDGDVPLELQLALNTIYAEAEYQLTLHYDLAPPPPVLNPADAEWAAECVAAWQANLKS